MTTSDACEFRPSGCSNVFTVLGTCTVQRSVDTAIRGSIASEHGGAINGGPPPAQCAMTAAGAAAGGSIPGGRQMGVSGRRGPGRRGSVISTPNLTRFRLFFTDLRAPAIWQTVACRDLPGSALRDLPGSAQRGIRCVPQIAARRPRKQVEQRPSAQANTPAKYEAANTNGARVRANLASEFSERIQWANPARAGATIRCHGRRTISTRAWLLARRAAWERPSRPAGSDERLGVPRELVTRLLEGRARPA